MEYDFRRMEKKWQQHWQQHHAYEVNNNSDRPAYYVLDMFPYPSGTGLHVGHPLGYIASDIFARYKRSKGFNVLHPMGYDAFGLPAEQYALDTGQHPAVTTEQNIATFRQQLDHIGLSFDWSRQVKTSDPSYYRWTQWIFLQLFNSWYNPASKRAEPISTLTAQLEGFEKLSAREQSDLLMNYRLAYCGFGEVNWCEALGTVLANDEVVNGVSERGGYPVVKKKLRQWYLRITAYADRLLEGLEKIEFSDAMKDMQTNWIGRSSGAEIDFALKDSEENVRVYTTRPDTIFGVDFMVVAPEHDLIPKITTASERQSVDDYVAYVKSRSERERMAEKTISGVFTGAYALNPFNGRPIPVWISEYVLAGYGTGAIMAVPCGDERDNKFARHFQLPITNIIGKYYNGADANPTKDAVLENSDFLNGVKMKDAIGIVIDKLEGRGIGKKKVNYKIRDAAFSRQRYWGEPFPIKWIDGAAVPLSENELPLQLPVVDSYSPGPDGEGPLANIPSWTAQELETNTMPGYAGSSWYFLRYMDPHNDQEFCSRKASDYWGPVDLYIGGTEHAVGHLLYSRMWTKALFDLGHIGFDEPFKKLVNQGMITGVSAFAHFVGFNIGQSLLQQLTEDENKKFNQLKEKYTAVENWLISSDLMPFLRTSFNFPETEEQIAHMDRRNKILDFLMKPLREELASNSLNKKIKFFPMLNYYSVHVPVSYVNTKDELDCKLLKTENPRFKSVDFILNDSQKFICSRETEKMSKSKFNTFSPDDIVSKYGADTFRMYEMFLGPVEMSKPWDTKGIEGVHRFLKKLWRLFFDDSKGQVWNDEKPTNAEFRILHRAIKKVGEDNERFSFNTAVSTFMITVNELTDIQCHKKEILDRLLILLQPYAPHISEELWHQTGNASSILAAPFPQLEEQYLVETSFNYPVSINGKMRTQLPFPLDASQQEIEQTVSGNEVVRKWLEGKSPDKVIYVKGKMINVVVKK